MVAPLNYWRLNVSRQRVNMIEVARNKHKTYSIFDTDYLALEAVSNSDIHKTSTRREVFVDIECLLLILGLEKGMLAT